MDILEQAKAQVRKIKKENPDWAFPFIVGKVATWHNIEYQTLIGSFSKKPKSKKKEVFNIDKHPYPKKSPWWIKY